MIEGQRPPYDFRVFRKSRFQPIPGYENIERAPQVVIGQTDSLLRLYKTGAIRQLDPARGYLHDYTSTFLDTAAQGVKRVFTKNDVDTQPLDVNEAADVANVVFAWMHYFAISPFLPNGFSRRGMLQAPTTSEQFLQRIAEIKRELALIVTGLRDTDMPLEAKPSALRAHTFFRVGSIIPLKFPDSKEELAGKKEAFDKLLGDIQVDLP